MQRTTIRRDIVVVAASLGGLAALKTIVAALPSDFPASIFIVMHIGTWPSQLPQLLAADSPLPVVHASDGEAIAKGTAYVAPPDRHMLLRDGIIGSFENGVGNGLQRACELKAEKSSL
ncbi:chemotaxis protein CheB, partial [Caballeronia sp. RCC_10]|uniref:chemotaxis protein CheB n=1 Tax=Caballeronia sp. RCC_10 TaxID=3239227 RepID=UPI0035247896